MLTLHVPCHLSARWQHRLGPTVWRFPVRKLPPLAVAAVLPTACFQTAAVGSNLSNLAQPSLRTVTVARLQGPPSQSESNERHPRTFLVFPTKLRHWINTGCMGPCPDSAEYSLSTDAPGAEPYSWDDGEVGVPDHKCAGHRSGSLLPVPCW